MPPELIAQLIPLGPTVVLVAMVLYSDKERKKLADIAVELIEDKKATREMVAKYEFMLKETVTINTRLLSALERIEKKLNR